MKKLFKNKKIAFVSLFVVVALVVVSIFIIPASADVIYTETPAQASQDFFQVKNYNGTPLNSTYKGTTTLDYDSTTGEYSMKSNTYVMWDSEDNIGFAYRWYHLEHGDQGKMTIETTITRHDVETAGDEMHDNASVGIHIRGTDDKAGKHVYLHARSSKVGIVYRDKDGAGSGWVGDQNCVSIKEYPIHMKVEVQGNAIRCMVKFGEEKEWTRFATRYINLGENVMAGIASHSCNQKVYMLDKFKDYSVTIEGPAGSKYTPVGSSGDDDEDVEENPCPPDPDITDSTLFRETFTDGSLTNETDYPGASTSEEMEKLDIANPIWTNTYSVDGDIDKAVIETDSSGENRYWHRNGNSDAYFFTNKQWFDYSYSVDLKFGEETNLDLINRVDLYTRFQANRANGFFGYRLRMTYGKNVELRKIYTTDDPETENERTKVLTKVNYNYIKEGWNTWRIEAFDNTITVYCNNEKVLTAVDNDTSEASWSVIGRGGIGIGSSEADLLVDNMIVEQMTDLLGGDYDNKIGGNWDSPTPDFIQNFKATLE